MIAYASSLPSCLTHSQFGVTKLLELKEGGATIPVTNENKKEFVQLSATHRLYSSIKDQIESLLAGFYDVIPKDLISIVSRPIARKWLSAH